MKTTTRNLLLVFSLSLILPSHAVFSDEQVYGSQLMTERERHEHRMKMQSMKTEEERHRYRLEHHKLMQQRAKQQGLTLPDMPQSGGGMMNKDGFGSGGGGGGRGR